MRLLPLRRFALCSLLLQAVAMPVQAVPTAAIQWGACPTLQGTHHYDPNSTSQTITVTGTGFSGTIRTIYCSIGIWAGGSQVSEAWRFDPAGCQSDGLTIGQGTDGSCPPLRGSNAKELSRVEYFTIPPGYWSGGRETIRYAVVFDPMVADPATTYTIARFDIDHSNAIVGGTRVAGSCNCLERPLCISIGDVFYQDADGEDRSVARSVEAVHWNDTVNALACPLGPDLCEPACGWNQDTTCVANGPTPSARHSWGRVKAGYR